MRLQGACRIFVFVIVLANFDLVFAVVLTVIVTNCSEKDLQLAKVETLCKKWSLPLVVLNRKNLSRVYGPTLVSLMGRNAL